MLRGLQGRRVGLVAGNERDAARVSAALESAGASIVRLQAEAADEDWHSGKYAALVLLDTPRKSERTIQLVREFLAADKPLAARGSAVSIVLESGGAAGRTVAAADDSSAQVRTAGGAVSSTNLHVDGCLITATAQADVDEFARVMVREFAAHLDESAVDEMSDLSFPASDPPAVTPSTAGPAAPDPAK